MENKDIIRKIQALLSRTVERGATEHEAKIALEKANALMIQHDITEIDLKKIDKNTFIDVTVDLFRLDLTHLFTALAETFECENYYNTYMKKFHFFGFELDAKLCVHFAKMLTGILKSRLSEFKKSVEYKDLACLYQPKALIRSFVFGFSNVITEKLDEIKKAREEIITSSGTALMVVKFSEVQNEFNSLFSDIKEIKVKTPKIVLQAMMTGEDKAENVTFNTPIDDVQDNYEKIGVNKAYV